MNKHINKFATESAYLSAYTSLTAPDVSLIAATNDVKYKPIGYGKAGSIVVYSIQDEKLYSIPPEIWSLETYPTAYYPIVCITVKDDTGDGTIGFTVKGMNSSGEATSTQTTLPWHNSGSSYYYFDWGTTNASTDSTIIVNDYLGKDNTSKIQSVVSAYTTDIYSGSTGEAVSKFELTGTSAGDWYIPSVGEMLYMYKNMSKIKTAISTIYTADTTLSLSVNNIYHIYTTSSEYGAYIAWGCSIVDGSVRSNNNTFNKNLAYYVLPFIQLT